MSQVSRLVGMYASKSKKEERKDEDAPEPCRKDSFVSAESSKAKEEQGVGLDYNFTAELSSCFRYSKKFIEALKSERKNRKRLLKHLAKEMEGCAGSLSPSFSQLSEELAEEGSASPSYQYALQLCKKMEGIMAQHERLIEENRTLKTQLEEGQARQQLAEDLSAAVGDLEVDPEEQLVEGSRKGLSKSKGAPTTPLQRDPSDVGPDGSACESEDFADCHESEEEGEDKEKVMASVRKHTSPIVIGERSAPWEPILTRIGPPDQNEQYELSDYVDSDVEDEEAKEARRESKKVPAWCKEAKKMSEQQIPMDPESVFGLAMPRCDLSVIFTDQNYREAGKERPMPRRGLGCWRGSDKLTQEEIDQYRHAMGQFEMYTNVFEANSHKPPPGHPAYALGMMGS